jgi:hypothetical protein
MHYSAPRRRWAIRGLRFSEYRREHDSNHCGAVMLARDVRIPIERSHAHWYDPKPQNGAGRILDAFSNELMSLMSPF